MQKYLSKLIIKKELIEGNMADISESLESIDRILINSGDPEFNQSCLAWGRRIENRQKADWASTQKIEVLLSSRMGTLGIGSVSPTAKWKEQ